LEKTIYTKEFKAVLARVIEARKLAGLRQVDVAEKLGVDQTYISKMESGQRRMDVVELWNLARIYNRPISYFFKDLKGD